MAKFYATFGTSSPLGQCYVEIDAFNEEAARDVMFEIFDRRWGFVYGECQKAEAIDRYDLQRVMVLEPTKWGIRPQVPPLTAIETTLELARGAYENYDYPAKDYDSVDEAADAKSRDHNALDVMSNWLEGFS